MFAMLDVVWRIWWVRLEGLGKRVGSGIVLARGVKSVILHTLLE